MQTTFVNQPMAFAKKHKTVFYYGEGEGVEAKRLADIERSQYGHVGLTRDASVFDGELENCNAVVILPNVRAHDRAKIEGAYGGDLIKVRGSDKWLGGEIRSIGSDKPATVIVPEAMTVHGPKANPEEVSPQNANPQAALPLVARHRGFGKFYVMRGEETVSGPHSKAEAMGLVR